MWTNIFVLFEHQQQKNVGVLVFFFFFLKIQIPTSFFVLHLCEKEKFLRNTVHYHYHYQHANDNLTNLPNNERLD